MPLIINQVTELTWLCYDLCLFCPNVTDHKFSANPLHSKAFGHDLIPNMMIVTHNMPGVFGVPVGASHRNCAFTIEKHRCRFHGQFINPFQFAQ